MKVLVRDRAKGGLPEEMEHDLLEIYLWGKDLDNIVITSMTTNKSVKLSNRVPKDLNGLNELVLSRLS